MIETKEEMMTLLSGPKDAGAKTEPDEPRGDSLAGIGPSIRELRKSRRLTLAVLAAEIQRSIGFISEVERGMTQPTLKDVYAIADVFQVPVSWFFDRNQRESAAEADNVVRAGNRRWMLNDSIRMEVLSPRLGEGLEFMKSTYAPGAETKDIPMRRAGKEVGILLSGQLEMWIDGVRHFLEEGDSYALDLSQRFHSRNPSEHEEAVLYWCVSHN